MLEVDAARGVRLCWWWWKEEERCERGPISDACLFNLSTMSASGSRSPSPVDAPLPPSLPDPLSPLTDSYTYHSPCPTADGPYHLGVDEAGRGPALGPLVYAVAFCPESYVKKLEKMGFDGAFVPADPSARLSCGAQTPRR